MKSTVTKLKKKESQLNIHHSKITDDLKKRDYKSKHTK